jgi:flavin reductase (DIM6/NTAB) family NADH-FMN oxidoreductase RutF
MSAASAAIARVATNVAIVTTRDTRGIHGSTANAWAENADPPFVVITLDRGRETHERVIGAGIFAVNLLAVDQRRLAAQFASDLPDRFAGVAHRTGESGAPLIDGCVATIECRVHADVTIGSYAVITGTIVASAAGPATAPLLFFDGAFHELAPA